MLTDVDVVGPVLGVQVVERTDGGDAASLAVTAGVVTVAAMVAGEAVALALAVTAGVVTVAAMAAGVAVDPPPARS